MEDCFLKLDLEEVSLLYHLGGPSTTVAKSEIIICKYVQKANSNMIMLCTIIALRFVTPKKLVPFLNLIYSDGAECLSSSPKHLQRICKVLRRCLEGT